MELTTWTIYQGKDLKNIENKVITQGEFPFLLLRPDLNKGNEMLGLAIIDEYVASAVMDLINRPLGAKELTEIFKDKMGLINIQNIQNYSLKESNISLTPIQAQNIKTLMETYNILIKEKPITFDTKDYDTDEKVKNKQNIFLELNFQNMPTHQLINAINSGMTDFYKRLNDLREPTLTEHERQEKMLQMNGLETNLIFFFEQTLKRMDEIIAQQDKRIKELEAGNFHSEPKKDEN